MLYQKGARKGNAQFILSHDNIKKNCHKKKLIVFFRLREENFLKVAPFVIFPASAMVWF